MEMSEEMKLEELNWRKNLEPDSSLWCTNWRGL